jgi:hypothetical protein
MLHGGFEEVQHGVREGYVRKAQDGTKRCLESLHELNDSCVRRDWSTLIWEPDELETWEGLMGARNLSHHSGAHIVRMGEDEFGNTLTWSTDRVALDRLWVQSQAVAFKLRVDGHPVIPMLARMASLIEISLAPSD